ncbi:uncharacterized protein LOC128732332 [Sabethes cyaneus]|uniref:uncharacterized protein LOC128732332 n=1 Tax=Sabethes cyaneus TaxID=53552 RepID=UPI00237EC8B4|nr:uncharacterized protein LOC128732332 [Sabethes cyaneus]
MNEQLQQICHNLAELERLELVFCERISDAGFRHLNVLQKLTELRLWGIKASKQLFQHCSCSLSALQKLLIYSNESINGTTLRDIGTQLTRLSRAVFYDCYWVDNGAIEELKARLPHCEVLHLYDGDDLPHSLANEEQIYNRSSDSTTSEASPKGSNTVKSTGGQGAALLQSDKDNNVVDKIDATTSDQSEAKVDDDVDKGTKKEKKLRCLTCRKKVGLVGCVCRCGGLFCGLHRYSDKHDCSFDYRSLAAGEIKRNNPIVTGEKIRKI